MSSMPCAIIYLESMVMSQVSHSGVFTIWPTFGYVFCSYRESLIIHSLK